MKRASEVRASPQAYSPRSHTHIVLGRAAEGRRILRRAELHPARQELLSKEAGCSQACGATPLAEKLEKKPVAYFQAGGTASAGNAICRKGHAPS